MNQSPSNWRDMLVQPSADVNNWWSDWYKKAQGATDTINNMPFVFDPQKGAGMDQAALKAMMYSQPTPMQGSQDALVAQRTQAAQQGGGLLQPGVEGPSGGLLESVNPQAPQPQQMPVQDDGLLQAILQMVLGKQGQGVGPGGGLMGMMGK